MKTIKERAKELYQGNNAALNAVGADGYIQGATVQQVVDIVKACDWLEETIGSEIPVKFTTEHGVGFLNVDKKDFISQFKKMMEGE